MRINQVCALCESPAGISVYLRLRGCSSAATSLRHFLRSVTGQTDEFIRRRLSNVTRPLHFSLHVLLILFAICQTIADRNRTRLSFVFYEALLIREEFDDKTRQTPEAGVALNFVC